MSSDVLGWYRHVAKYAEKIDRNVLQRLKEDLIGKG